MTTQIPPEAHDLFDRPAIAMVATVMPDGSPQVTPVWITRDGGTVVFNSAHGRTKPDNIARDPRVAVTVVDPDNPYRYVQVRGRAELTDEGAEDLIDELSEKYLGKPYPFRREGERRVTVRVTPESVDYHPR